MISLNSSVIIYRPIQQVFDFVSVADNDFQWQYGTLESAQLSAGAIGVGTFFRSIGHLMGQRLQGTFEVTEYETNKKYGFQSRSGALETRTLYTFEIAGASTRVSVSTEAHVTALFRTPESGLQQQLRRQLNENLAALKGLLEGK